MNAGASTSAGPSPMEGSGTAWVLLGAWALSPARPTPIHPRPERRGFSALLVKSEAFPRPRARPLRRRCLCSWPLGLAPLPRFLTVAFKADTIAQVAQALARALPLVAARAEGAQIIPVGIIGWRLAQRRSL